MSSSNTTTVTRKQTSDKLKSIIEEVLCNIADSQEAKDRLLKQYPLNTKIDVLKMLIEEATFQAYEPNFIFKSAWLQENFTSIELLQHGIYTAGNIDIINSSKRITNKLFLLGNACMDLVCFDPELDETKLDVYLDEKAAITLETAGMWHANILAFGENKISLAMSEVAYGYVFANSASKSEISIGGQSKLTLSQYHRCTAKIETRGLSSADCHSKDNSFLYLTATEMSRAIIGVSDNCTLTTCAYNESVIGLKKDRTWNGKYAKVEGSKQPIYV